MDNPNPIYYKDLITPDDSITKLIDQLDELVAKYDGAKSKIQGAAADVAKGLQGVSGASEEQRKSIELATQQTEKLEQEYRSIFAAQMEAKKVSLELAAAKKEETQVTKLLQQLNVSAAGSYNRLSAQYRLNKIRLNEMSAEERKATEAGRALEKESAEIYEEMKRLQEATGKHSLNVGNYADAGKSLRQELRSLTSQMAYLKTQGEQDSQEYQEMSVRAGQLKDALRDANREVKAVSSDTRQLNTVMGAASAASGGLAAITGTMALFGATSENATDAQKKLGAAIGILSGLTLVQNQLQKESNLMTGIRTIQTKLATKAENMDTAAKTKNVVATTAATVAQKIFNAVANANPYVLLAMAIITVVGALAAFAASSGKATNEQKKMNDVLAVQLDYLDRRAQFIKDESDKLINSLDNELKLAKARGASDKEIEEIEDRIYRKRMMQNADMRDTYKDQLDNLEQNKIKLNELNKTLLDLEKGKAEGAGYVMMDIDLDGKVDKVEIDEAIDTVQGQLDYYGRSVQIAVDLNTEKANIETEREIQLINRRNRSGSNSRAQRAKAELDARRKEEDMRLETIEDAYEREHEMLRVANERAIEDIKNRLKNEKNLTAKAKEALNNQLTLLEEKYLRDEEKLRQDYAAKALAARRETEDLLYELMADGADKQREKLRITYEREIEDLKNRLDTSNDLSKEERDEMTRQLTLLSERYGQELNELNAKLAKDRLDSELEGIQLRLAAEKEGSQEYIDLSVAAMEKRRQIELLENSQLAEDVRQNEADINAKWDAAILKETAELIQKRGTMLLEAQQQLAASEFALLNTNERQKTQFQLEMERERLKKLLELDEEAGFTMTEQERQTIKNTIAALEKESKTLPYANIYELLGLGVDENQQSAINDAVDSVKDSLSSLIESWAQVAEAATTAAEAQVQSAQQALDAEIEARNAGYANAVEDAQRRLDLARSEQQKALREKEKAQRAQQAIDSVTQSSSLVTASANLWSSLSAIPGVGPALALAAIATMWSSFAYSKVKAAQVTKQTEKYGEGVVELLQGGSHASGHDIDLGTKPDGTRRRAEGGEFFAIINKRNSRRYRTVIPDVINSLNNGTFAARYQRANARMAGYAVGILGGAGTDVSGIERDVAAIRKQGDREQYVDGHGNTVVRYKNLIRIYKN